MGYTKKSNYCSVLSKDCLETCGCCVADPPSFCEKASDESAQRIVRAALAEATAVVPLEETAVWAEDILRNLAENGGSQQRRRAKNKYCRSVPQSHWTTGKCLIKCNKKNWKKCKTRHMRKCEKKCEDCTCNSHSH